ncbi:MAG: hypothetical protein HY776_04240 [Actinobacteria bacterium]|nr:hypothetical protein [Actinomycetota bacterium]
MQRVIYILTCFFLWLMGIFILFGSIILSIAIILELSDSPYIDVFGMQIMTSFSLLVMGLITLISTTFFLEKTIIYLYYIAYFFGTISFVVAILMHLLLMKYNLTYVSFSVVGVIVALIPFVLFQISFIRVHRLLKKM